MICRSLSRAIRQGVGRRLIPKMAAALVGMGLAGCAVQQQAPQGYYGPTEPMPVVIQQVNQNNRALPTLYANIRYIDAWIVDPKTGKTNFVNAEGNLFMHKPRELLLRGRKALSSVFELGSTEDRYWMTVLANDPGMWWGWYRNVGKDCVQQEMPIRPEAIGEVLGIGDIPADLTESPVPTMRFNNDLDVYMITWNARLPDRWYAEKEIWYDRQTLRPRKVLLFDRNGRPVLRADLSKHQRVRVADLPEERWPWVAMSYDLFFPDTKSRMVMELAEVALTSRTGQPKAGMISFPEDPDVPADRVIQIDQDCEK